MNIVNKIDSAIGTFWGAFLFIGILVTILIGRKGNGRSDWFWAVIIGGLVFLIGGLLTQGVLTLFKKS